MNTVNTNIKTNLDREENILNIRDSYLEIDFFVFADNARAKFLKIAVFRLNIYGMVALFPLYKIETCCGMAIE